MAVSAFFMRFFQFPVSQNGNSCVLLIETLMNIETFNSSIVPMRGRLLARARSLAGDDDSAEDLVQEVMLKLWSMRDSLGSHANPEALAMAILRNKATDLWRRRKTERSHTGVAAAEPADDNTVEHADEMKLLQAIVDSLPPLQARIFRMKDIEGYESSEIISITGCSPDSLRQCLSRARRKIREEFVRLTAMRGQAAGASHNI